MNKTPVDLNEGEEAGTDDEDNSSVLDDDSVDEETDDASETPPPPIELPDRLTRGRRLRQDIDDEEEEADNQFWTQDFFAEGKGDSDYETESVNTGDEGDSDFSKSESSDEDAGSEEEKLMRILKPKKCKDKPPGWKQAAQRRANFRRAMRSKRPPKSAVPRDRTGDDSDGPSSRAGTSTAKRIVDDAPVAPTLRKSTYQKVQTDELKRQFNLPRRPAVKKEKEAAPVLTMEAVLSRAAADSIANRAALAHMVAREEESKARASAVREPYCGPLIKWRSCAIPLPGCHNPHDAVAGGEQKTAATRGRVEQAAGCGSSRSGAGDASLAGAAPVDRPAGPGSVHGDGGSGAPAGQSMMPVPAERQPGPAGSPGKIERNCLLQGSTLGGDVTTNASQRLLGMDALPVGRGRDQGVQHLPEPAELDREAPADGQQTAQDPSVKPSVEVTADGQQSRQDAGARRCQHVCCREASEIELREVSPGSVPDMFRPQQIDAAMHAFQDIVWDKRGRARRRVTWLPAQPAEQPSGGAASVLWYGDLSAVRWGPTRDQDGHTAAAVPAVATAAAAQGSNDGAGNGQKELVGPNSCSGGVQGGVLQLLQRGGGAAAASSGGAAQLLHRGGGGAAALSRCGAAQSSVAAGLHDEATPGHGSAARLLGYSESGSIGMAAGAGERVAFNSGAGTCENGKACKASGAASECHEDGGLKGAGFISDATGATDVGRKAGSRVLGSGSTQGTTRRGNRSRPGSGVGDSADISRRGRGGAEAATGSGRSSAKALSGRGRGGAEAASGRGRGGAEAVTERGKGWGEDASGSGDSEAAKALYTGFANRGPRSAPASKRRCVRAAGGDTNGMHPPEAAEGVGSVRNFRPFASGAVSSASAFTSPLNPLRPESDKPHSSPSAALSMPLRVHRAGNSAHVPCASAFQAKNTAVPASSANLGVGLPGGGMQSTQSFKLPMHAAGAPQHPPAGAGSSAATGQLENGTCGRQAALQAAALLSGSQRSAPGCEPLSTGAFQSLWAAHSAAPTLGGLRPSWDAGMHGQLAPQATAALLHKGGFDSRLQQAEAPNANPLLFGAPAPPPAPLLRIEQPPTSASGQSKANVAEALDLQSMLAHSAASAVQGLGNQHLISTPSRAAHAIPNREELAQAHAALAAGLFPPPQSQLPAQHQASMLVATSASALAQSHRPPAP